MTKIPTQPELGPWSYSHGGALGTLLDVNSKMFVAFHDTVLNTKDDTQIRTTLGGPQSRRRRPGLCPSAPWIPETTRKEPWPTSPRWWAQEGGVFPLTLRQHSGHTHTHTHRLAGGSVPQSTVLSSDPQDHRESPENPASFSPCFLSCV